MTKESRNKTGVSVARVAAICIVRRCHAVRKYSKRGVQAVGDTHVRTSTRL